MASMSSMSDQTFGFSLPKWVESCQSATMPVPQRWRRNDGLLCRSRPAMSALMLGSWSDLPLSVELCQAVPLNGAALAGDRCLRTTTPALEASSERVSEES